MSNWPTCRRRVSLLGMLHDYTNFAVLARSSQPSALKHRAPGLSPAGGGAVIGKVLPRIALQVTILIAAVCIEVRVPGKIDGQGLVNVVVLKNVVDVGRIGIGGNAPKASDGVRRCGIRLNRVAGKK